ncbi:MAG: hypothetical protein ABI330_13185, partial [Caldimonas sp.]
ADTPAMPEAEPKVKPVAAPKAEGEVKPKSDITTEANVEALPEATPQLVKRVHALYEQLGREDVRAVEAAEKAQLASRKDDAPK